MKISFLEPCGYCAGVDRAINLAIKVKKDNPNSNVVVLGMLVHNSFTLKTLEEHGIKTIYKKGSSLDELVDEIKEPSIVILSAHGHSKALEEKILKNDHKILDATCPFVAKSMDEIKNELSIGKDVFYIGVRNHPEANAALSLGKKVHLIDISDIKIPQINNDYPVVISQTTLSEYEVASIYKQIKTLYKSAKIVKGICNASTQKQKAILSLDKDVDKIFVVGDLNSNNCKTLFELAKKTYPTIDVQWIQGPDDVNPDELMKYNHVVFSSGASTPSEILTNIRMKFLFY